MTKKQKRTLGRILLSALLFAAALSAPLQGWVKGAAFLPAYLLVGWDVLTKAGRNILHGQVFDENFLMTAATVGAFGCGEWPEAVAVMLFYQVGELFQSVAVAKSRRSIAALTSLRPDWANVEREGRLVQVEPDAVGVGDLIVVRPGERVPLDGVVVSGACALDTAALTGESLPRDVAEGDEVLSGSIVINGLLQLRVIRPFASSAVSRILELVEQSMARKSRTERFITRFARWYTPAVVCSALALALLPPLLGFGPMRMWLMRALVFLVVSCPCALVISIPLSFFGGIGAASRQGILVKGGSFLELLAKADIAVFDKTGTLTQGSFRIQSVLSPLMAQEELLRLAAGAEQFSSHPIAQSIRAAAASVPEDTLLLEELPGCGVHARVDGRDVHAGNASLMAQHAICVPEQSGTVVYVSVDGIYAGAITLADLPKPTAQQAIAQLKRAGVRRTVMLTGDSPAAAERTAQQLGLDEVHAQLLPEDKVALIEQLLREKAPGRALVYTGDGINDAPVLARADVGIAMGALGSDAAIEAADVVLMDDDPARLVTAIKLARKTVGIATQNIIFALGVKFFVLALSALGLTGMWWAVFADVGVAVLAILNAGRMLGK
ncbi:MAG: cadmium-translocating P-type ATPase [Oscillospiraceae bacterium]|nr:cadmium-translocating P-type ATPase [Oscillospiraceae bacterium]